MNLGMGRAEKQAASQSDWISDIIRPSTFEIGESRRFRIIRGVWKVSQVWYPTLGMDPETNEVRLEWTLIHRPRGGCLLDEFAAIDKRLQVQQGVDPDKAHSQLEYNNRWNFLVFDRLDSDPTLKRLEVGWSIFNGIMQTEEAVDDTDKTKLRNGPIQFYDIIIDVVKSRRQTRGPSRIPEAYQRSYDVQPDPKNPFAGRIPTNVLVSGIPQDFEYIKHEVFTEEELKTIKMTEIDLELATKPHTTEEILQKLTEKPIFLNAQRRGDPVFPSPAEFAIKLEEAGHKYYLEEAAVAGELPASTTTSDKEEKTETTEPAASGGIESALSKEAAKPSDLGLGEDTVVKPAEGEKKEETAEAKPKVSKVEEALTGEKTSSKEEKKEKPPAKKKTTPKGGVPDW